MGYSNDAYNYMPNAPQAPQYSGQMTQFNYDFQTSYPPAPSFNMNQGMGISCPAPPGMGDNWIPPPSMTPSETDKDRLKREGKNIDSVLSVWLMKLLISSQPPLPRRNNDNVKG
jgi:hypothetical protein